MRKRLYKVCKKIGGVPNRIRTYDLRIRNPLLYPAELWAHDLYSILQKKKIDN
jgi:hypothetical protein